MDEIREKLTVFFDDPFWAGVFERTDGHRLSACKVIFGAEPKDYEVLDLILHRYGRLKFSPSVDTDVRKESSNPKRLQREAHRQTEVRGIGTRSQQALQLQREENRENRKTVSRRIQEEERQKRFEQKQQKRKEKHRGR